MANPRNSQVTTLDDDAPAQAAPAAVEHINATSGSADFSGKRRTITIHPTPDPTGNDPVFVGVNGIGFLIPRNKPCSVPEEVVENLQISVQTMFMPDAVGKEVIGREVQRFPFSVHA